MINIDDYYSASEWNLIKQESEKHKTPFILINLDIVEKNYKEIVKNFPFAKVYCAVKANPAPENVRLLKDLGSYFDVASRYELDTLLENGISTDRVSFGNTIKKAEDIKYFYDNGCRLYVSDSEDDLLNIAKFAPNSNVFFRLLVDEIDTADWPLSHKFGADASVIEDLIKLSVKLGLKPKGVSFHVGSQQRDTGAWDIALKVVAKIFNNMKKEGIELDLINMGGGFPANCTVKSEALEEYAKKIKASLTENFGEKLPTIILEPGRSMFGNSGILVSEVILISKKSKDTNDKWLYIDAGKYNGLIETLDEAIRYPLYTDVQGEMSKSFIIAGPTCDSTDVMYEKFRNPLPENIKIGDRIYWLSAGAYTSSYCSVNFNGFPPVKTYFISSKKIK
ncbi:MAG: type III PLP-dependent enzyme [Rickettsiales bacterium]|nr:type III PLP-dependent enzyme [Rickettsiales bacterium]